MGIRKTLILGYPDAGFINGPELREKLIYYVRKFKADRIITFDPWVAYEVHPDHLIVGRMAAEAGAFAEFPLLHPEHINEGIKPYSCSEVWFMGLLGHPPNCFVDISTTLDKKVEADLKFEATLELLVNLFTTDIDPANVSQKELKELSKYAIRLMSSITLTIGRKTNLKAAEAFII